MVGGVQTIERVRRKNVRRGKRNRSDAHSDELVLNPSRDCVVGFQRVPNLRRAIRLARRQRLKVQYVQRDANGTPMHAVVEWKGKPVIITDCYDGTEIH